MKTYLFIIYLLCSLMLSAQNCQTTFQENAVILSGWDVSRTDYSHSRFESVTGIDMDAQFNYSGPKDQEEFGYPWFYYKNSNTDNYEGLHFAGIVERINDEYQGRNHLRSFKLTTDTFNVNGVVVGDSIQTVRDQFNDYCEDQETRSVFLRYDEQEIRFYYYELSNTIYKITFFTPI